MLFLLCNNIIIILKSMQDITNGCLPNSVLHIILFFHSNNLLIVLIVLYKLQTILNKFKKVFMLITKGPQTYKTI